MTMHVLCYQFRKYFFDVRGNTLIIVGFSLPILVMLVGGAVDYSRAFMVRSKAQLALDSGVLAAAASVSSQPPEMVAHTYMRSNFPDNYMESSLDSSTLVSSSMIDAVDNGDGTMTVDGTLTGTMPTYMLRIIGISQLEFEVKSQAQRGVKPIDLVLVADHSGSMCFNVGTTVQNPACPKLQALKSAAHTLIDTLYGTRSSLDGVYVSIVPYATHVKYNTGSVANALDPNYGGNGMDPSAFRNPNQTSVREYSGSKAQIDANIDSMNIDLPTAGEAWTRINVGLDASWRMLRPDYNSLFVHTTVAPRPFDGQTQKAVVLMTDGRNITYCPNRGGIPQPKYVNTDDNNDVLTRCGLMKLDGIIIYTVAFDLVGTDPDTLNTKNLLESCASNPNYFFDVSNSAAMTQAFREIGDSLRVIRLSR